MRASCMVPLLACAAALSAARAAEVDGVAAVVGSEQILRSEVVGEMRRAGAADESRYAETLNALVERKLAARAAKDMGLTLQEWVVDNRVREIVDEAFGGDRNRLVEALAKQRTPYADWRQRIKDDMIVSAIRWHAVDKHVSASPAEVRAEYEAHPDRYAKGGKASVAVILLKPADAAKRGEVETEIRTKGFASAAKKFSADGKAKDGGLWRDVVPEEVFRPEICDALAKLAPGKISRWIDIDGWSFLLKNCSAPKVRTFEEAYEDVEANVRSEKSRALYKKWMDGLKSETYIKTY